MMNAIDVSVVIVSWNVQGLLRRCLASAIAERRAGLTVEIIVVDNASHDGSAELVASGYPDVTLIANQDNRGVGRGCNQGIAAARGRTVLLLNPDAELRPGSLAAMLAHLDAHPETAAVGPQLLNDDGTVQPSRRRFPTLAGLFLMSTLIEYRLPNLPLFRGFYCADRSDSEPQPVDWLVGACLLLRRTALEQIGGLDERFFMYFEETDWFQRAADAGWTAAYLPGAAAVHAGGRSSAQDLPLRHIRFNASRLQYAEKHFGALTAGALRPWLVLMYLAHTGEETLKLALRHRPDERRQNIGLLAQVARAMLRP
ncbi:MAG: glycosyltransferase family 2 protein [Chloroflexi bacterium]|nr:glycosyltransferase family 2 protein [Chloroflexota bacterium]